MFITHAADVLAETANGLTGPEIITLTTGFAVEKNVSVPYQQYPFQASNKRTVLRENLTAFPTELQFELLDKLCAYPKLEQRIPDEIRKLRLQLHTRYGHLAPSPLEVVGLELVQDTRHWLNGFPEVLGLYDQALAKYRAGVFQRNVLDDLRLALETLVKRVLGKEKSLENQLGPLGDFVSGGGGSPEFVNMFVKLIDYFTKYQNRYVKHDDAVIEDEVKFVIELTSAFMKHLVRLSAR
jgi:hypothetical protein